MKRMSLYEPFAVEVDNGAMRKIDPTGQRPDENPSVPDNEPAPEPIVDPIAPTIDPYPVKDPIPERPETPTPPEPIPEFPPDVTYKV